MSADYGWLRSPDSTESARVLFKAGKACQGYVTNNDILKHATTAMDILEKHYPTEEHVFVFDNATTHLKHDKDSLSATLNHNALYSNARLGTPPAVAAGFCTMSPILSMYHLFLRHAANTEGFRSFTSQNSTANSTSSSNAGAMQNGCIVHVLSPHLRQTWRQILSWLWTQYPWLS